jgi:hypothetical protein
MNPYITQRDSFDDADVIFQAPLLSLPSERLPTPLHRRLLGMDWECIRDQGTEPYCTAMALASVIDYLVLQREGMASPQGSATCKPYPDQAAREVRSSARMLYEMAKAFDEYPDDDNKGSSLRGAIKGFYHNGVYRRQHDDQIEIAELRAKEWVLDIDTAKQSRQTILGRYARVGPSILDYQSAIADIGIIYASASIHSGWELQEVTDNDGVIQRKSSSVPLGNHAFAIIGYTRSGFLVLNSSGIEWGGWSETPSESWPGVALWHYDDWSQNVLDAWVLRLGAPIDVTQFSRLDQSTISDRRWAGFAGQGVTRLLINGHYLHMADGQLASRGVFTNDQASINETASLLQKERKYTDLVFFVESGLESIDSMTRRCASITARLKSDFGLIDSEFKPYPISVIWREDVLQVTEDLLASRAQRIHERTRGYADAKAHMLDAYARDFLQPIWRTFEGEAERSFTGKLDQSEKRGQAWPAMQRLLAVAASGDTPMGIHFVVHSSGMPWFQAFVQRLARVPGTPDTLIPGLETPELRRMILRNVTLITPICTVNNVRSILADLWGDWSLPSTAKPRPLGIYAQTAACDAGENLCGYSGSFLELARRCFPLNGSMPTITNSNIIAGHSDGARELSSTLATTGLLEIMSIATSPSSTHAGLMSDSHLLNAVFQRIKACGINSSSLGIT